MYDTDSRLEQMLDRPYARGYRAWESQFDIQEDPYERAVREELDLTGDPAEVEGVVWVHGSPAAVPLWYDELPPDDGWEDEVAYAASQDDAYDGEHDDWEYDVYDEADDDWYFSHYDFLLWEIENWTLGVATEASLPLDFVCPKVRFYRERLHAREGKIVKRSTRCEKRRQGWLRRKRHDRRALRCGGASEILVHLDNCVIQAEREYQEACYLSGVEK